MELLYINVARIHTGVKVEREYHKCLEDLGKPKVEPSGMIYDGRKYLLTQRGTGNIGNVGSNTELHREGAAHNTTKPKTRVGQDLLARPLTEVDSSNFAMGVVLSQQCLEDGKWHPVTFLSKSLSVRGHYVGTPYMLTHSISVLYTDYCATKEKSLLENCCPLP